MIVNELTTEKRSMAKVQDGTDDRFGFISSVQLTARTASEQAQQQQSSN